MPDPSTNRPPRRICRRKTAHMAAHARETKEERLIRGDALSIGCRKPFMITQCNSVAAPRH